jgi:hypothetical protein
MNKLAPLLVGIVAATEMGRNDFKFMKFIATHNKNYATLEEYAIRFGRFVEMDKYIEEVNAPNSGFTHTAGHNKFSDWTKDEFEKMMTDSPMEAVNGAEEPVEM